MISLRFDCGLVVLALLSLGCADDEQPVGGDPPAATGAGLPQLQEIELRLSPEDLPDREPTTLGLTASGQVAYVSGSPGKSFFIAVDTLGSVTRWGREGEGPGEARRGTLLANDSMFVFVASDPPSVLVMDAKGKVVSQLRGEFENGFPGAAGADFIDRSLGQRIVGKRGIMEDFHGPIVRNCLTSKCERTLLAADDSILRLVHEATPQREGLRWPPYAAEAGRFALGDGVSYRVWYFNDSGRVIGEIARSIPRRTRTPEDIARDEASWKRLTDRGIRVDVEAERAAADTQTLPHFAYGSMGFDGNHRLWIVGKTENRAFLDVFADNVFLGRHEINCRRERGAMAVKGRFLAVVCETDEGAEAPYAIRLFRILESAPDSSN